MKNFQKLENGAGQTIGFKADEFLCDNAVSMKNYPADNKLVVDWLEQLSPSELMPEAERLLWAKCCKEQREFYDRIHPSPWAGMEKSRGWVSQDVAVVYFKVEGYAPRVRVWYPKKFEAQICDYPLKGVHQGNLVETFHTEKLGEPCINYVLIPGNEFAVIDCGTGKCNYGQPKPERAKVVFRPGTVEKYNEVYTPTVATMEPGYDTSKDERLL